MPQPEAIDNTYTQCWAGRQLDKLVKAYITRWKRGGSVREWEVSSLELCQLPCHTQQQQQQQVVAATKNLNKQQLKPTRRWRQCEQVPEQRGEGGKGQAQHTHSCGLYIAVRQGLPHWTTWSLALQPRLASRTWRVRSSAFAVCQGINAYQTNCFNLPKTAGTERQTDTTEGGDFIAVRWGFALADSTKWMNGNDDSN